MAKRATGRRRGGAGTTDQPGSRTWAFSLFWAALVVGIARTRLTDSENVAGVHRARLIPFPEAAVESDDDRATWNRVIDKAKQESVDAILEMAGEKATGRARRLVVTGCLTQRYDAELRRDFGLRDPLLVYLETADEGGLYDLATLATLRDLTEAIAALQTAADGHHKAGRRREALELLRAGGPLVGVPRPPTAEIDAQLDVIAAAWAPMVTAKARAIPPPFTGQRAPRRTPAVATTES
ncbi:MAG: hypothetical protein IH804_05235 [Planctomycetes bacterium]|nr:hypothetical protein [Planctomycetota bacterium]